MFGKDSGTFRQFIYFAGIGVIGTGGHYLTLILLVELLAINPGLATTAGFLVGALINYILNYRFTFRSSKRHSEALSKFLLVAAVGAVLNYAIMQGGLTYTSLHYLLIQVVATGVVLLWNFIVNKRWTFSESGRASPE